MTTLNIIRKDGESDAEYLNRREGWTQHNVTTEYGRRPPVYSGNGWKACSEREALAAQALADQPILLAEIDSLLNLNDNILRQSLVELTKRDELIREIAEMNHLNYDEMKAKARALLATTNERMKP